MNKDNIIAFFNSIASSWDDEAIYKDEIIASILNYAEVEDGKKVLDVACGTGFLFENYYKRNVQSLTGIDISVEMLKICSEKFPDAKLICADAEDFRFEDTFDTIVIHNAYPHFCNPIKLFKNLTSFLTDGGRITVSHDMSREELNGFHQKRASDISSTLPEADELSEIMNQYVEVDKIISNNRMYLVSGIKK